MPADADTGAPVRGHARWRGYLPVAAVWALTIAAGFGALLVQWPAVGAEPVFVITNAAVTVSMVALGGYLVVQGETFCGLCFAIAGACWLLIAADIYPGWGGWVAFVLGGGAPFFVPIAWGVLRYGRPRLTHTSELVFIPLCVVFTSGLGAVWSLFNRPEWGGLPASDSWPALWPDPTVATVLGAFLSAGFIFIAVYFALLLRRTYREAPPTRKQLVAPLYAFGAAIALGSSLIYTLGDSVLRQLSFHSLAVLIAVLALALTSGLAVAATGRQQLASQLVQALPVIGEPEHLDRYVREVLRDETAAMLFWDAASDRLVDARGRVRPVGDELRPDRFCHWVSGGDGRRLALLTGTALLGADTAAVTSLVRLVSVLVENISLQAGLRLRIAQLTAAQTAQHMAFEQARIQFQRDLHDGVQQTLAAARMDLEGIDEVVVDDEGKRLVSALEVKLGSALEQVRGLRRGEPPPELGPGLGPAIERVAAELLLDAHIEATPDDLGVLAVPVYYVVREALTNVYKYAAATKVVVKVETDGRVVTITVADDGRGGAVSRPGGGIDGIRRRLADLGGSLRVDSRPGSGTMVTASVPCV